ncbi:MAG: amidohydrolase family protein [Candidatus Acidiferrales bacterium]|jgi:L-fuconolactonase
MIRLDAHQHFWKYNQTDFSWITDEMAAIRRDFSPAELERELAANGIDATIAVQVGQNEHENAFLLNLAAKHKSIAAVVGWVDLSAANVRERLRELSRHKNLRGFRHIVESEPDDRYILREDFLRGLACLKEFNFTYDILIFPKQLPAAVELVKRMPEQPFVVDHIAKPLIKMREIDSWARHMRLLAAGPNVYCKISGMITEADWKAWRPEDFAPYLDVVFDAFGPDRLMFGSDWPVCLLAGTYRNVKQLVEGYISRRAGSAQDARKLEQAVFGGTAARFYGIAEV